MENWLVTEYNDKYLPIAEVLNDMSDKLKIFKNNIDSGVDNDDYLNEFIKLTSLAPVLENAFEDEFIKKPNSIEADLINFLNDKNYIELLIGKNPNFPLFLRSVFAEEIVREDIKISSNTGATIMDIINAKLVDFYKLSEKVDENINEFGLNTERSLHQEVKDIGDLEEIIGKKMRNLNEKSSAFFSLTTLGEVIHVRNNGIYRSMQVPNSPEDAKVVKIMHDRFENMTQNDQSRNFSKMNRNNVISETSYLFGFPLYYYANIKSLKEAYESMDEEAGTFYNHTYVTGKGTSEWTNLPDLVPYEVYSQEFNNIKKSKINEENHNRRKEVFELALKKEIIRQEDDGWYIYLDDGRIWIADKEKSEADVLALFQRMHQNYYKVLESAEKRSLEDSREDFLKALITNKVYLADNSPLWFTEVRGHEFRILNKEDAKFLYLDLMNQYLTVLDKDQKKIFDDELEEQFTNLREKNYLSIRKN